MQNRPEGCILQRSSTQRLTKLSTVSLGKETCMGFYTHAFGTSSHNIHKIIKGSNLSFETSDDNDYNLSRRFIDFRKHMSEMFTARDSVIFLLQHPGFVIPLKKCVLYPVQEIELLGLILNSHTMTL